MNIIEAGHRFRPEEYGIIDFLNDHGCNVWVRFRKSGVCGWMDEVPLPAAREAMRFIRAGQHLHAVQCMKTIEIDDKSGCSANVGYDPEWLLCTYGEDCAKQFVEVDDVPGACMLTLEFTETNWDGKCLARKP